MGSIARMADATRASGDGGPKASRRVVRDLVYFQWLNAGMFGGGGGAGVAQNSVQDEQAAFQGACDPASKSPQDVPSSAPTARTSGRQSDAAISGATAMVMP